jgi:hypothetical protein
MARARINPIKQLGEVGLKRQVHWDEYLDGT